MLSGEVMNELEKILSTIAPTGKWKVPTQTPPLFVLDTVSGGTVDTDLESADQYVTVQVTATGKTAEQAQWLIDKALKEILASRLKTGWQIVIETWNIPVDPQIEGFYSFIGQIRIRGEV